VSSGGAKVECPVCFHTFLASMIELHAIRCLDEQQSREDEQLGRSLLGELRPTPFEPRSDSNNSVMLQMEEHMGHHNDQLPPPQLRLITSAPLVHRAGRSRLEDATRSNNTRPLCLSSLQADPKGTLLSNADMQDDLVSLLQGRHQLGELELVYKNSVHGNSLATLYSCADRCSPLIILVEDAEGYLFGCFLTNPLKCQKKPTTFSGTGEAFLFTLRPEYAAYRWSGINGYYVATSTDSICVGCGGGGFGLRLGIEGDVTQGASSPCETFLNPPLGSSEFFDCRAVEVWRLA